jgi:hypothetical protein
VPRAWRSRGSCPGDALDQSFNGDGPFFLKVGDDTLVRNAMLDDHDRITLVSQSQANGNPWQAVLTRLLASGKPDPALAGDGTARFDLAAGDNVPRAIAPSDGASVLIAEQSYDAGATSADGRLFAVTGGGQLDTSYSGDGKATLDLAQFDNPWDLRIDGSGRAYLAMTVLVSEARRTRPASFGRSPTARSTPRSPATVSHRSPRTRAPAPSRSGGVTRRSPATST